MRQQVSDIEQQIDEILDRVNEAGDNAERRAVALEEYLQLAYADEDESWLFDVVAWSEDLIGCYLTLGRVDDAMRVARAAAQDDPMAGPELLCDLAEKLMRTGGEPQARLLWSEARTAFPDDIWVYVQAGIEYSDLGDHATALSWLTPGLEQALRTGDPDKALEQLIPLRASCLAALGQQADALQLRAGEGT